MGGWVSAADGLQNDMGPGACRRERGVQSEGIEGYDALVPRNSREW